MNLFQVLFLYGIVYGIIGLSLLELVIYIIYYIFKNKKGD